MVKVNNKIILKQESLDSEYSLNHDLIRYFGKNIKCAKCGVKGSMVCEFRHKNELDGTRHIGVFGINANNKGVQLTIDHILPKSWGGSGRITNKQILCYSCNINKSNILSTDELLQIINNLEYHYGGNDRIYNFIPTIYKQHKNLISYETFGIIHSKLENMVLSNSHKFGPKMLKRIEKQMVEYLGKAKIDGIITTTNWRNK